MLLLKITSLKLRHLRVTSFVLLKITSSSTRVELGLRLRDNTRVGPGLRVRDNTRVGPGLRVRDNTRVGPGLRVRDNTRVGYLLGAPRGRRVGSTHCVEKTVKCQQRVASFPRGVHAARHFHAPCVEKTPKCKSSTTHSFGKLAKVFNHRISCTRKSICFATFSIHVTRFLYSGLRFRQA